MGYACPQVTVRMEIERENEHILLMMQRYQRYEYERKTIL
jgi:hypothetical protein